MAKKRKWLKNTPWQRGLDFIYSRKNENYWGRVNEKEMLFCMLIWLGMPRTYAYGLAFPESKAEDASVVQLASRLMQSWKIRNFFRELEENEKRMNYRYTKDMEDAKHPYGY